MRLWPELTNKDDAEQTLKDAGFPAFFQGVFGLFAIYGLSLFTLTLSWVAIPMVVLCAILIVWALRIRGGKTDGILVLSAISLIVCILTVGQLISVGIAMPAIELLVYICFGIAIQLVLAYFVLRGWIAWRWLKSEA